MTGSKPLLYIVLKLILGIARASWNWDNVTEDMPDTPGYQLGTYNCSEQYKTSCEDYQLPEDGDLRIYKPTHLIGIENNYLLVFGSSQGSFCDQQEGIGYKYMTPGTNVWTKGPQIFAASPFWIPGGGYPEDFDGLDVLYSSDPIFPTPRYQFSLDPADLRQWVMYYSVYISTNDILQTGNFGVDQACIGRATATGPPEYLIWTDDGKPVYCSNVKFEERGYPATKRYNSEAKYVHAVNDGYGVGPAISIGQKMHLTWGSGLIHQVHLKSVTGHLANEFISSNCGKGGPCKDAPTDPTSNYERYNVLSVGAGAFNDAPYILEKKLGNTNYHFLFVNWWGCCAGVCSTNEIRVGRSGTGIAGPYLDKNGLRLDQSGVQDIWGEHAGGGSVFLQGEGRYVGPGHAGVMEYVSKKDGEVKFVFTFQYYDKEDNGIGKLGGKELFFDGSRWPLLDFKPWDICDFIGCIYQPISGNLYNQSRPVRSAASSIYNCPWMIQRMYHAISSLLFCMYFI